MYHDSDIRSSIRAEIEQAGWSVRCTLGEPGGFPSAYTVGLSRFALPEIIVFGIGDPAEATQLLGRVATRALQTMSSPHAMCPLVPGTVVCDLFAGMFPAAFIEVDEVAAYLPIASLLYGGNNDVTAVQLVLPDSRHRWPWHPESELSGDLPLLGAVPRHLVS